MARVLLALLCYLGSIGLAQAQSLLILGDSLSAGYQMPLEKSWPSLLQERWVREGDIHRAINASISGETTQGALTRLPALLKEHQPDWVLIELGGNDGLRGFPPQVTERNLTALIDRATAAGAKVILTQIRLPPNYGARYVRQFEQIYPGLAEQYRLPLMPFFLDDIALHPELMMNDGIHPKPEAQPRIRDTVARFVAPLLQGEE
ncbi:arylesterase [Aeromonas simiae]|uniref:arylesterase n=1 Tax=Aeromonas simiae TaxID=218936 RepID=UPI0005AB1805|nr:arylesterase [Aeromonas simiae]MDO2947624.1 arylesterase [Aeromonas simiae]MDO2951216.1 arylesterase [Aeromonas simiae]MDO2955184.1 arylesterase [Aeromonas simiae]